MPDVIVTTRSGEEITIHATSGTSLMENLRDSGQSGILAVCGGCCSCATCHVYVAEQWRSVIGSPNADEADILSESSHYRTNSRLSCQVVVKDSHHGLCVTVAPED
jgi:ferredoxin, 2Fe-2S